MVLVNARGRSGANSDVWEQLRQQSDLFDGVLAWSSTQFNLGSGGQTQWVDGITASGSFFRRWAYESSPDAVFSERDDRPGDGPTARSLSSATPLAAPLQRHRGRHWPHAAINRVPFTIVGVTPPDFFGPAVGRTFDVIVPLSDYALLMSEHGIANNWLSVMARRKPGQRSSSGCRTALSRRTGCVRRRCPRAHRKICRRSRVRPAATGYSQVRGQYSRPLFTVMAVVATRPADCLRQPRDACCSRAAPLAPRAQRTAGSRRVACTPRPAAADREPRACRASGATAGLVIAWWGSRLLVRQFRRSRARPRDGSCLEARICSWICRSTGGCSRSRPRSPSRP